MVDIRDTEESESVGGSGNSWDSQYHFWKRKARKALAHAKGAKGKTSRAGSGGKGMGRGVFALNGEEDATLGRRGKEKGHRMADLLRRCFPAAALACRNSGAVVHRGHL